ncbi:SIS domain-containing protein [Microbacterium esteraromaticum]|uniref:SIS domain-containing protein n=1 Tax=Microbacterium esteraromaticum TaxID=57043 RepID=A0A7D8A8Y5_9MICO|nr:SIS domain-containing protein [Microbacterium esteraromaticum]QMU97360.1 SIS domain-containing protein [Microbacterium esteraromaticum]
MTHQENLTRLIAALETSADVRASVSDAPGSAVFTGSGDSLSSALLAQAYGHRAMSSGDITFMGRLPVGVETVVGISHSGTSGATVQALRLARSAGARTIAITSNSDSPLAEAADEVQVVPSLHVEEAVPVAGHLMLGLGVAAVCGADVDGATSALASRLRDLTSLVEETVEGLPAEAPVSISLLSLPDLRGAADFWMLKLIEATGLAVRSVPLEESGHVDYFLGPQPHLAVQLLGAYSRFRFDRLAAALEHTGQTVQQVAFPQQAGEAGIDAVLTELGGAVVGTVVAEAAAGRWGRPPFRGGAVNMDAAHIKLDAQAIS